MAARWRRSKRQVRLALGPPGPIASAVPARPPPTCYSCNQLAPCICLPLRPAGRQVPDGQAVISSMARRRSTTCPSCPKPVAMRTSARLISPDCGRTWVPVHPERAARLLPLLQPLPSPSHVSLHRQPTVMASLGGWRPHVPAPGRLPFPSLRTVI